MKKNIKRFLAFLAVFALMSANVFSSTAVSAWATEGSGEQQEEMTEQETVDTEIEGVNDVEDSEEDSEDESDDSEESEEDSEENEGLEESEEESEEDSEEAMQSRPRMMLLGTAPTPVVSFDLGEGGGTVQYKINDGDWTDASNIFSLENGDTVYLKATPAEGKKIDDYQDQGNYIQNLVRYNNEDHYFSPGDLSGGSASFTYNSEYTYSVKISFVNDQGGPGPDPSPVDPGKYTVSISQEAAGQTGEIKVEFFNGSESKGSSTFSSDSSWTDIPEGTDKVTISITSGSDILNNARLENRTDGDEFDLIDDMRADEANHSATRSIDIEKSYEIKIEFSNTMSVSWTYDTSDPRKDMIVEHARIELLNSDNATDYKDYGITDWQLTVDETYYFVLIPEYGYQVSGLNINGQEIAPMNSVGVFKFVMSHSNFHLQGIVTPFSDSDVAQITPDGMIGGMSVDGAGVVDSGNVMVKEQDKQPDNQVLDVVDSEATVFGTMDLAVSQAISKGNGDFWETPMSETNTPVRISVGVPAEELADGETYSIVRNHEGVYEELDADYDPSSENLSFESDKFSEYTIIKKKADTPSPAPSPSDDPKEQPAGGDSSDTSSSVPATVPDTTVVVSVGGANVTQKDMKENVAVMVGDNGSSAKISTWNELAVFLVSSSLTAIDAQLKTTTNMESNTTPGATATGAAAQIAKPLELILCKKNTVVPELVFASLTTNTAPSLHLHLGNGVAVNFINDARLINQKAVDLNYTITAPKGYATRIAFKSEDKLSALTSIHATVPKAVKSVNVYRVDKAGKRTLLGANIPVVDGRYCFLIDQLGVFEIEY